MKKGTYIFLFALLIAPFSGLFAAEEAVVVEMVPIQAASEVALEFEDYIEGFEIDGGFFTSIRVWQMENNAGDVVGSIETLEEIIYEGGFGITFRKSAQRSIVYSEIDSLTEKIERFADRSKISGEELVVSLDYIFSLKKLVESL